MQGEARAARMSGSNPRLIPFILELKSPVARPVARQSEPRVRVVTGRRADTPIRAQRITHPGRRVGLQVGRCCL